MFERDGSLPPILRNEGITWLSPYQISNGNFGFRSDREIRRDLKIEDVLQGFHGGFFLSGIISLIETNNEHVRNFRVYPRNGLLEYAFYKKNGSTVRVRINDLLPTRNGRLVFAQAPNNRFWCPLLEKAYAKFLGGYQHLALGTLPEVIQPLTGCLLINHKIETYGNESLLNWIRNECDEKHPVICKQKHSNGNNGEHGRAFAVMKVISLNNEDLICVRDPKKPTSETLKVEDFKRDFDLVGTTDQCVSNPIRQASEYDDCGRNRSNVCSEPPDEANYRDFIIPVSELRKCEESRISKLCSVPTDDTDTDKQPYSHRRNRIRPQCVIC